MTRSFKWLLNSLAALSLLMCVATVVIWAKGGWVDNRFHQITGNWYYTTDGGSFEGRIQLVIVQFGSNSTGSWPFERRRLDLQVPFWGATLIWLILPIFAWVVLPIRRFHAKSVKVISEIGIASFLVEHDLPCAHCAYNLRSQYSIGKCPECGAAVADSLSPKVGLTLSRPEWLRRVAAGNVLLFFSRIFLGLTFATSFHVPGEFRSEYLPAVCFAGAAIVLYFSGIFLLTSNEYPYHQKMDRKDARKLRKLSIFSQIFLAAGICYQTVISINMLWPIWLLAPGLPVEWSWVTIGLLLVGWLLHCWCVASEFMYLEKLARRLGSPFIARHCVIAGLGAAGSSVLLLRDMQIVVEPWPWATLLTAYGALVALWFLFLIWTSLLNLDFALRFMQQARLAKQRSATPDLPAVPV